MSKPRFDPNSCSADTDISGEDDEQSEDKSFDDFADTIRRLFPDALAAYAHMGRTIHEALLQSDISD